MEPVFEHDDKVTFKVAKDFFSIKRLVPLWDFQHKSRVTGDSKWTDGVVVEVGDIYVTVEYCSHNDQTETWEWPLCGHSDYSPDQWERDGYLRHANSQVSVTPKSNECTCDIGVLMSSGCHCGAFHQEQKKKEKCRG